jgi:hypothetical protein
MMIVLSAGLLAIRVAVPGFPAGVGETRAVATLRGQSRRKVKTKP